MMINFDYIKPDDVVLQCGGTNRNIVCLTFVFPIVPLRQMIQRLLLLKPGYSREACGVGGLFLNLFFSEILILHIPKLCSLVYCFQNCFCFLSTTFPFHVGTFGSAILVLHYNRDVAWFPNPLAPGDGLGAQTPLDKLFWFWRLPVSPILVQIHDSWRTRVHTETLHQNLILL